ncbi:MAG: DNA-directed RNA polymerase subunit omega [Candidatus Euphemobacter frigidus]|nr:DNA-directed RNA polymerase subunit omega [Candidatus Euphemobacter frigidus]MDP8276630.1 DNA-directed RNA polymerase subunit omega [Candidatus Euphemobacter frigidus]
MRELTTERYLKKIGNVYSLVILAAKRTVSLKRGDKSLLPDVKDEKPSMVALDEIAAGKITLALPEEKDEEQES